MKRNKPVLQILASHLGVYEVGVRAPADQYQKAERLSAEIQPAINIIDRAVRQVYAERSRNVSKASATSNQETSRSPEEPRFGSDSNYAASSQRSRCLRNRGFGAQLEIEEL
jgi:hypothetical protein